VLSQPWGIPGNPKWDAKTSVKVMVAFGPQTFGLLEAEAKERGVSVQELLRAVIIPEWFRTLSSPIVKNQGFSPSTRIVEAREGISRPNNPRL